MPTLRQTIEKLTELRHRKTIYENLINHLSAFVGSDTQNAESEMTDEVYGQVPEDLIQKTIDYFQETAGNIDKKLSVLEGMEIPDAKEQAEGQAKPSKGNGKKVRSREGAEEEG